MSWRVSISPEAEAELLAAAEWYESKRPGLGLEFVAVVDHVLARVGKNPLEHPVWKDGEPFRKAVLHRFPFVVFFTVSGDEIEVRAVAHARRRPGYWR